MNDLIFLPPADDNDEGIRLDVFLSRNCQLSRSAAVKLIEEGFVFINGISAKKKEPISSGDVVSYRPRDPLPDRNVPQEIPLDILYEDEDLLVVNKPRGMVVHPAAGNPDKTLVNALLSHCGESLSGVNGVIRPGIVHRIDKDTSGLLVVAKNDAAHISLAAQIASHSFERSYEAIVVGAMSSPEGVISGNIGRSSSDRKKMAIVPDPKGKRAVTHFKVLQRYLGFSHLSLQLETGRTHQIRVHLASCGHPIVGDRLYGARDSLGLEGQCLHARTISFLHPKTGEFLRFESDLPDYFRSVLDRLIPE